MYRRFTPGDHVDFTAETYGVETALHEAMLQSRHRTYNPNEADLFYVPGYIACYIHPVFGAADWPHWPGKAGGQAGHVGTRTGACGVAMATEHCGIGATQHAPKRAALAFVLVFVACRPVDSRLSGTRRCRHAHAGGHAALRE